MAPGSALLPEKVHTDKKEKGRNAGKKTPNSPKTHSLQVFLVFPEHAICFFPERKRLLRCQHLRGHVKVMLMLEIVDGEPYLVAGLHRTHKAEQQQADSRSDTGPAHGQ